MTTAYHDLLADIALRVNAILGPVPETLQDNYSTRPLSTAQFGSSIYPFDACVSALLMAEERLATTMASTSNPTLRAPLHDVTAALASGDVVPAVGSTSASVIGILGSVRDADDSTPCKEKTLEEIERFNRNADTFYVIPVYAYKFDGERIYHTRTEVTIDCCVYNREAQLAAVGSNSDMLLPDDFGEAIVCGALAILVRDDEDTAQAELFASYFKSTLERIAQGLLPVPSKVIPGPSMTATAT